MAIVANLVNGVCGSDELGIVVVDQRLHVVVQELDF